MRAVQVFAGAPRGTAAGVLGDHVGSLAGGLTARGVEVTVCGPADAAVMHHCVRAGARFAHVETARQPGPWGDALAVAALRPALAGAGVVHAHGPRAAFLASLAVAGRKPLVVSWHGGAPHGGGRLLRLMERRAARSAAVVLAASYEQVDRVRRLGARDVRLAPVAPPPPGDEVPAAEAELLRQKTRAELGAVERPLVLSAGRLEEHKGYDLLLDAAVSWRALDPRPLVVVAGEGSRRGPLQRRIDAEDLPVRLVGDRDDLPWLLSAADLVVQPGRRESHPHVVQHTLRAGVPLVATAVGGVPELVGDAAVLVPYGEPRTLARAVTALLTDPRARARLATAGPAQAATWPTEDDTVAQVLSLYDELTLPGPAAW
nr:glycosyltransferase family 4 protein [Streptomyces sp. SID5468]